MVVPVCEEVVGEEVVGKLSYLFEPVHALGELVINPYVVGVRFKIVLFDDFLEDYAKLDARVLWSIKWGFEVEI